MFSVNYTNFPPKYTFEILVNDKPNVKEISRNQDIKLKIKGTGAKSFTMTANGGSLTESKGVYTLIPSPNSTSVALTVSAVDGKKKIALGVQVLKILD